MWNDARCVIEILGGELFEILYNVMQWPVGQYQRAYSSGMLR